MRSLPNSNRWIGVLVPGRVYRHSIGMTPRKLRIVVMCDRCRRSAPPLADADFPRKYATKSARRKEGESPQCDSSVAVLRCTITIFFGNGIARKRAGATWIARLPHKKRALNP